MLSSFSYFKAPVTNTSPAKTVTLVEVYEAIKSNFSDETAQLRQLTDPQQARAYKAKHFDYATFSGTFTKRCDQALVQHSGLLALDFDHLKQVPELAGKLLKDPYFETQLLFTSPSGQGLKWVIGIDSAEHGHATAFQAIQRYVQETYQVEVDSAGKDVSRACYLPHDPNVYLHPNHLRKDFQLEQWLPKQVPPRATAVLQPTFVHDEYQHVGQLVLQIEAQRVDLTSRYEDWRNIGFALSDAFGERGRHLYHRISQFHPEYDVKKCDQQFDYCFQAKGAGVTLGTLFYLAQNAGVELPRRGEIAQITRQKPKYNNSLPSF